MVCHFNVMEGLVFRTAFQIFDYISLGSRQLCTTSFDNAEGWPVAWVESNHNAVYSFVEAVCYSLQAGTTNSEVWYMPDEMGKE